MSALTEQINYMADHLQEPEQIIVYEVVRRLLPDDIATLEDLADIAVARAEYELGKTINHDDIDWN